MPAEMRSVRNRRQGRWFRYEGGRGGNWPCGRSGVSAIVTF